MNKRLVCFDAHVIDVTDWSPAALDDLADEASAVVDKIDRWIEKDREDEPSKPRLIDASLPQLTDDQQKWLDKIVGLVESGKWAGMLELKPINELLEDNIHNATWKSSWTNMEQHFHARGLKPSHTPFEKNVSKASWGLE